MLEIVCFKWKPTYKKYRSKFEGRHVNILRNMVRRNYNKPHRFNCITDDPKGIDSDIRIIPLWKDFGNIASPYGIHQPSCYRRLKLFSPEARELIGERFVSMDLDVVITGDLEPIFDRPEDFVALESATPPPRYRYNGSMLMMTAGARTQIWKEFDPYRTPQMVRSKGFFGSDQAWISYKLGPGEAMWGTKDGIYSYRIHLTKDPQRLLPDGAKIVIFHGIDDPWGVVAQSIPWVREHYR